MVSAAVREDGEFCLLSGLVDRPPELLHDPVIQPMSVIC